MRVVFSLDCCDRECMRWRATVKAGITGSFGSSLGLLMGATPTPIYSPESNGMAEAFVKTVRRDYVYLSRIDNAVVVLERRLGKLIFSECDCHVKMICAPSASSKKSPAVMMSLTCGTRSSLVRLNIFIASSQP